MLLRLMVLVHFSPLFAVGAYNYLLYNYRFANRNFIYDFHENKFIMAINCSTIFIHEANLEQKQLQLIAHLWL
jgi:hypothetical protein